MRALVVLCLLLAAGGARAQDRLRVDVHGASGRAFQVAVQRFQTGLDTPGSLRDQLHDEIVAALEFSGVMKSVPPRAFLGPTETTDYSVDLLACENWRPIGADALLQGVFEATPSGLTARFRVWDTVRCRMQGRPTRFEVSGKAISLLGRRIADEIVYRFTGRRGVSATQIAFVSDRTGNKEIYVMEADGSGSRRVTGNRSINLFPAWSPEGDSILYTSYRGGAPDLWLISRGKRRNGRLFSQPAGMKYRGVWAPRNGRLAVVMHERENTDIFVFHENGRSLGRITSGRSIETSPTWSPDERRMAFVSDQSGSPQVYVQEIGGETRRLTFQGSYNSSPAWSPTGEWIAYAAQQGGGAFDIWLIDPDSGQTVPLVSHPRSDEEPHWSPDGRKLSFSSNRRGLKEIYTVDLADPDGSLRRLTEGLGNCSNPAWSPWLD